MKLEITGLTKNYGTLRALDGFCFTAECGVYAILGPNGAGKSTLINIITQNLAADSGKVLWDGAEAASLGGAFREILGYMPQQQQMYPRFSVERFLYYIAALKGLEKPEGQINQLIELCNLGEHRKKRLGALSGGMKQRVLIAQALLGDPKLVILDEPTAGLDPKERVRIRNLIAKVGLNRIVLIATHIVSDVELIAQQVLFMNKGVLVESGGVEELYAKMEGLVWDVVVRGEQVEAMSQCHRVVNITQQKDGIHLRIVSDSPVEGGVAVAPCLEDMYLYLLGDI
ncbi:MAG: ATP-binding cassette domain-containing protein [Oscillospiraceae bacterium]|nr:ATP-binding cassette domain-containing protein [Oscillospiraceae bacterium]